MGRDAASLAYRSPTFRSNVVVLTSVVEMSNYSPFLDISILENETQKVHRG